MQERDHDEQQQQQQQQTAQAQEGHEVQLSVELQPLGPRTANLLVAMGKLVSRCSRGVSRPWV